jgi:hypothetical protein
MPMITECRAEGCTILTFGPLCLDHERETKQLGEPRIGSQRDAPYEQAGLPAALTTG